MQRERRFSIAKASGCVAVAVALLAACSGNGWHSQTVVHSWRVPFTPTPSATPEPCSSDNEACQAFQAIPNVYVATVVELDDGNSYRLAPSDMPAEITKHYFTPGTAIELYRGRSKSGKVFYSIRLQGNPAMAWQVFPYEKENGATPDSHEPPLPP